MSHPSEQPAARLPSTATRFLTVCEGGNCRSVSLAMMLKATLQYDAVACSWKDIAPETRDMLCLWADGIIVMEAYMFDKIPEQFRSKTTVVDVGEDVWCNPFHPALTEKIQGLMASTNIVVQMQTRQ